MEVDTERERWSEAEKEVGEWKYLLQWLDRFCHPQLRREYYCLQLSQMLDEVRHTLSIHRLLLIFSHDEEDDKIRWAEAEVRWRWRAEKNEMAMLSIPLSETRFSLLLQPSQTRRDWCFSSNQRPLGSWNRALFPLPLASPIYADPARVDTSPLITWCEHCDIKINNIYTSTQNRHIYFTIRGHMTCSYLGESSFELNAYRKRIWCRFVDQLLCRRDN